MHTSRREQPTRQRSRTQVRGFEAGFALIATLLGCHATAAPPGSATPAPPTAAPAQRLLAPQPAPPLQANLPYTKIEVVVGEPLAAARGGLVTLGLKYAPPPVSFLQVPGSISMPIGPFAGGFDQGIANVDVRALLRGEEARILDRCRTTLDTNQRETADTVHDTTIPLTLNNPDGTVVASTSVAYQLGLTCKRQLIARIAYTKVDFDIKRPLAQAGGGQAAFTLTYNGTRNVGSVQFAGAFAYPLAGRQGPFEQTMPTADMRMMLASEEAAIRARCQQILDYNNANVLDAAHDTRIPVSVNGPDGAVIASTAVPYQLGLTCRR